MNIFISSFDTFSNVTSFSETSSSSHSDEEVIILASARPKKRAGRRVFKETRHPVYRGVRQRNKNKWVCEIRVPNNKKNSRIWLGTYPTPEMAARAHDVAALTLRGKSACLNFADSAWRLTLPESTDPVEIRRAATVAAKMFSVEGQCSEQSVSSGTIADEEDSPVVSGFEDLHDLIMSIANEPIMSPPPSPRDFSHWCDLDIFDTPISLWNF